MGQKLTPALKTIQSNMGAVASPLDCWLALRGLRTLHLRVQRQCQSAMDIANFLSHHPSVQKVHYPGLVEHPQHSVASQQMQCNLYGGVLSFEVQDEVFAMAVAGAVKTITRATSLGGTETLMEHRATIEPAHRITSPRGLLRLSVGLEHVDDLIQDLDTALSIAQQVTR
jgi:cystathionine gamma-synthase